MRVVCIYLKKNEDIKSIAEIFYRATPQIVLRGEQYIFLEISKCNKLYSEESFLARTKVTLKRLNIQADISIADDIPTALSFTVFKIKNKNLLPIESLEFFYNPLLKADFPLDPVYKMISTLKSLGLKTIQDFLKLPSKDISNRFGSVGLMTYMKVQGQFAVLWERFVPTEVTFEKFEFDLESPVENLEPIYFRLKPMLDKIVLRLKGKGKRPKQFEVIFKQEHAYGVKDQFYKVPIHLQLPYISSKGIFQITKERIDAKVQSQPFNHRITEFQVLVTEEAPYWMKQKDIFDQKKEENEESFFQLVSRVATRIGNNAVFFAKPHESYLPEKNWKRVQELNETPTTIDVLPQRPLRLLEKPLPIRFIGNRIVMENEVEEIFHINNKEIIMADWWESPLERIYFKLSTKSGKEFWIYKSSHGHYLHGVFD
jgi:hypothetical protein